MPYKDGEKQLLADIRAEARRHVVNDPEFIRQQQERERLAAEVYRDYYLSQIFHTAIPGHGLPIRNKAAEAIILGWLTLDETLSREWFLNVIQDNPALASELQWQSADPEKRKQAEARQLEQDKKTFEEVCRRHSLSECAANFELWRESQSIDNLAPASQTELDRYHTEAVAAHNELLLNLAEKNPDQLRARVREEATARQQATKQSEAENALSAARARDEARGGFPPLPPGITSEVIRKASPDQIKYWIKKYSNSSVTARLQNRDQ